MAHFKLEIGAPIAPIAKPTCGYTLTINYWHGDADDTSDETFFFPENVEPRMNDLQFVLQVLEYLNYHFPYDHTRCAMRAALVSGLDISIQAADLFIDNYWIWDKHYMDMMATPGTWSLIYTDQHGVDHHVKVSIAE